MSNTLYSIGEFSRMSSLAVKTLRFYHDKGLLVPCYVEPDTGYRHYNLRNLELAEVIKVLRGLDFSLAQIAKMLEGQPDDGDILEFLEAKKNALQSEIERHADIVHALDSIITSETDARKLMQDTKYEIQEKQLAPQLVGGVRMTGRYQECAKVYRQLGRALGRHISGKAMMLCYDEEFREDDADFEPCMPIKRVVEKPNVHVREIPGGRCFALLHSGPYESLSRSYARIMTYVTEQGLKVQRPSREIYIKGPGIIFKGNPDKYLTEIQFLVDS
jgi:DNA-binding transcriptional MerR regulator/effector-binding domain-containing protein